MLVGRKPHRGADVVAELEALGVGGVFVSVDLGDSVAAEIVMDATLDRFDHVDGLVNAAASTD
ncbi:MAG: hypothetical protein ABW046_20255, partial [Actinoplanes sp.]